MLHFSDPSREWRNAKEGIYVKKLTDLVQIKTVNIERIGKIDVPVTLATDREIRNDAGLSADVIDPRVYPATE